MTRLYAFLAALCLTCALGGTTLGWLAHTHYATPADPDPVIVLVPQPGDCATGQKTGYVPAEVYE